MQDITFNNNAFIFDNKIYIKDVKVNGLKINLKTNVFDDVRNKFVSAHCILTLDVLTVTEENHKRCIFLISPVNEPRS